MTVGEFMKSGIFDPYMEDYILKTRAEKLVNTMDVMVKGSDDMTALYKGIRRVEESVKEAHRWEEYADRIIKRIRPSSCKDGSPYMTIVIE